MAEKRRFMKFLSKMAIFNVALEIILPLCIQVDTSLQHTQCNKVFLSFGFFCSSCFIAECRCFSTLGDRLSIIPTYSFSALLLPKTKLSPTYPARTMVVISKYCPKIWGILPSKSVKKTDSNTRQFLQKLVFLISNRILFCALNHNSMI